MAKLFTNKTVSKNNSETSSQQELIGMISDKKEAEEYQRQQEVLNQ
jgi:hypothetical protein